MRADFLRIADGRIELRERYLHARALDTVDLVDCNSGHDFF